MREISRTWRGRRLGAPTSLLVWAALFALAWLDHGRHVHAQQAAVFSFVVSAIKFIVDVFQTVGAVVADSLVAIVTYLSTAVVWLLRTVGNVILSTGSIFAKVWDGIKIVWNDAIKPALLWVDRTVGRVAGWLKKTMAPIFTFLRHVKDELTLVWKRFVRPILDVIDFVHQLDRLLQVFHIDVLKGLDDTLQAIEARIDGVFRWIYGKLNDITNTLTLIVTADGFFQRYTLLRSLARDVNLHFNMLVNSHSKPLSAGAAYRVVRAFETPTVAQATSAAGAWLNGDASDDAQSLDAAVATWAEFVQVDDATTT